MEIKPELIELRSTEMMIVDEDSLQHTFLTGDQHFGHYNIIRYAQRPYETVVEMDAGMCTMWNSVVGPNDVVIHAADFTLRGSSVAAYYFSQLNGRIKVLGNPWHHDKRWLLAMQNGTEYYSATGHKVEIMPPMIVLELPMYQEHGYPKALVVCHYPIAFWDRKHYDSWHAHAHSHGKHRVSGFVHDIGVDVKYFCPISIAEFAEIMLSRR